MNREAKPLWDPDGRWVSDEFVKSMRWTGNNRLTLQVLTTANLGRPVAYGAYTFRFSDWTGAAPVSTDKLYVDVTRNGTWHAHCEWSQLLDAVDDAETQHDRPPEPDRIPQLVEARAKALEKRHGKPPEPDGIPRLEARVKALEETLGGILQRLERIDNMPR